MGFGSVTDRDNQGKVTGRSIIDRDNQASFSLIITDNNKGDHFSPNLSNPDESRRKYKVCLL